jgi:hypothetical protein
LWTVAVNFLAAPGAPRSQGLAFLHLGWLAPSACRGEHGPHDKQVPRGGHMRIKLICALTTITLFALPAADAFANHSW